jgi:CTP synthase
MTTGSVYLSVINIERAMGYNGRCVEVVPQIPIEVINRINDAAKKEKAQIVIIEIGGTVGEYENLLFLEAVKMLKLKHHNDVATVLVSYIPTLGAGGTELKTKPTQHAVRNLNSVGIQPDIILGRAGVSLDQKRKEKIQFMCGLEEGDVISAPNIESIYEVPVNFEKDNISDRILKKLHLKPKSKDMQEWNKFVGNIKNPTGQIKVGIVGKYFGSGDFVLADSYISVIESVKHAAYHFKKKPVIEWLNSDEYETHPEKVKELKSFDAIIVPGGFGNRGIEGKIKAIQFCRENKIPYLGLCYGMQLATIEFARNVAGLKDANTTEVNPKTKNPIFDLMPEQKVLMQEKRYGGSMRLGAYDCKIVKGTKAYNAYGQEKISERHRHRFEFNNDFRDLLCKKGLVVSGKNPERDLVEIIELKNHPFFVGTQFHPEFKSRPLNPHPLFKEFIKSAIK